MSADAVRTPRLDDGRAVKLERALRLATIAFCGVLPVLVVCLVFASAISAGSDAIDFRPFYRAAEDMLAGRNPYPEHDALLTASGHPYVYPPLPGLAAAALTILPVGVASVLVMAVLVLVALAIPFVLGVSDWRCYGMVLLWPPVISAIQTGNVTLWLALAAAVCWRFRERVLVVAATLGAALAVKFLLLPLLVWLFAARRFASAALAVVVGAGLVLASWAVIGFDGFTGYPDLLRRLDDAVGDDAYTVLNLARDLGADAAVAHVLWLAIGVGLLLWCGLVARSGDEPSSFVLALAASLALSPLVWLHYFALLIVAVAVARPRLGFIWFVPLATVVAPGVGHPSAAQTFVALTVAVVTFALALRELRVGDRRVDPVVGVGYGMTESLAPAATSAAARNRRHASVLVREHAWPLFVWAALLVWSLSLFLVVRDHYVKFREGRYDLGNMVQAVWSTAHGRPLEVTNGATGEQMVRLGSHVDPILAALTPFWLLAPDAADARRDPGRRRCARRAAGVLARPPPPRVGACGSDPRSRVPRLPVGRVDGRRRLPSRDARDPALPLRHLVPRLRPARGVRDLCRARTDVRRADGARGCGARALVRARARATVGRPDHLRRQGWRGRSSRSP